ncbi:3-oxoacyl-[acyl-carrier-protein] synthase III C-terminal domain-containing protein [Cytobacillus oceanisediminis]|uniref:3-oxoacyl-[acyl-carrier-protein] synthase III C-terminal domain-containing protein n=1 Tax=Cytobacillus oceanisediminis TaxID=665099 RepID=UPI001C2453B6|nr:3-oxoacyl-[acyl-carrier-protein] synthase III C-terminal domain-containing protein [Cytobacillus oceanisediminis]MBU8772054.1 hypothetical protein [Cytobacillus oceanisediminis]
MIGISKVSYYIPQTSFNLYDDKDLEYLELDEDEKVRFTEKYHFNNLPKEQNKSLAEMSIEAISQLDFPKNVRNRLLFVHALPISLGLREGTILEIVTYIGQSDLTYQSISHLNCATITGAFKLTEALLATSTDLDGIILVSADKNVNIKLRRLPHSLMGDGVAACYITKDATTNYILSSKIQIDPRTYNGVNSPPKVLHLYDLTLVMSVRKVLLNTLDDVGLDLEDISLFIVSNVNYHFWYMLAQKLLQPMNKFYFPSLENVGHAYNSDILINYCHAIAEQKLKKGDYFVTITIGLGSAIGCTILKH